LQDLIQKEEWISQATVSILVLLSLLVFTAFSLTLTILEYGADGKKRAAVAPEIFFTFLSTQCVVLTLQRPPQFSV
jgi:hypothetical protein